MLALILVESWMISKELKAYAASDVVTNSARKNVTTNGCIFSGHKLWYKYLYCEQYVLPLGTKVAKNSYIYQFTKLVLYCNTTQPVTKLQENFVFCR